jgi:hypothetical protein
MIGRTLTGCNQEKIPRRRNIFKQRDPGALKSLADLVERIKADIKKQLIWETKRKH